MAQARKVKELSVVTPNKVGMLAEVTGAIADGGVNITALAAWGDDSNAYFMIVAEDSQKAANALNAKKFEVKEKDVVAVTLSNKAGAAKDLAGKLSQAGVNLDYCYGSTGNSAESLFVFATKDINKALDVLK